jgi:hypothetical protein
MSASIENTRDTGIEARVAFLWDTAAIWPSNPVVFIKAPSDLKIHSPIPSEPDAAVRKEGQFCRLTEKQSFFANRTAEPQIKGPPIKLFGI